MSANKPCLHCLASLGVQNECDCEESKKTLWRGSGSSYVRRKQYGRDCDIDNVGIEPECGKSAQQGHPHSCKQDSGVFSADMHPHFLHHLQKVM